MYLSRSLGALRAFPLSTHVRQLRCVETWLHTPASRLHTGAHVRCSAKADDDDDDDDEAAVPGKPLRVERLLANLGYGKRKECAGLIKSGRVTHLRSDKGRLNRADKVLHGDILLDGEPLDTPSPMALMLHKPTGYVVTAPDDANIPDPKVYDLLPFRFGRRRPCVSCVGRLDKNTSGLIMLTDDGQLVHRINSPKKGIWKIYEANLADPLKGKLADKAVKQFESGTMVLPGEFAALLPARLTMLTPTTARVALCEGKYHQIRRMFEVLGHTVTSLHRLSVGGLGLDDLAEGQWRYLTPADVEAVFSGPTTEDMMAASGATSISEDNGAAEPAAAAVAVAAAVAAPSKKPRPRRVAAAVDAGSSEEGESASVTGRAERGAGAESSGGVSGAEEEEESTPSPAQRERGERLVGSVQGWRESLESRQAAAAVLEGRAPKAAPQSEELLVVKKFRDGERWQRRREALKKIMPTQL